MVKTDIEGIWIGKGVETDLIAGQPNSAKINLNLILKITKESKNIYRVHSTYKYIDSGTVYGIPHIQGSINYTADFLILKNTNKNKFISEDDSGMGISYYDFVDNKLYFKYNITGMPDPLNPTNPNANPLSLIGTYKLHKM